MPLPRRCFGYESRDSAPPKQQKGVAHHPQPGGGGRSESAPCRATRAPLSCAGGLPSAREDCWYAPTAAESRITAPRCPGCTGGGTRLPGRGRERIRRYRHLAPSRATGTLVQEKVIPVGIMPADIDGPHNLTVSPDNRFYYISIAHGTPFGTLWKMDAATDTLAGRAPLEMFPTTIGLTPDGELAFVANSDFHGDHPRQNVISIVHTPTMSTITHLAGLRHAARSQVESRRDGDLHLLHEQRRTAADRGRDAAHHPPGEDRHRPRHEQHGRHGSWCDGSRYAGATRVRSGRRWPGHELRADVRLGVARRQDAVCRLQPRQLGPGLGRCDAHQDQGYSGGCGGVQRRAIRRWALGHRHQQEGAELQPDRRAEPHRGGAGADHEEDRPWNRLLAGRAVRLHQPGIHRGRLRGRSTCSTSPPGRSSPPWRSPPSRQVSRSFGSPTSPVAPRS